MYVASPALYGNNLDAFIPEQWANETLAILVENMQAAGTVHRDFEMEFQKLGDTVNTRKPRDFAMKRKHKSDDVTDQDAIADNVAVVLNQHCHVSYIIDDGDETLAFKSLVEEYIRPASIALARGVDRIVLGQAYQFIGNQVGTLGGLSNSNAVEYITESRRKLNELKAPDDGRRYLALGTVAETKILQNATFHQADQRGDQEGLLQGFLGQKFGFKTWMGQNVPSLLGDGTLGSGAIDNGNIAVGSTVLTVDGFGASEVVPGQWISIGGRPYHVIATDNATATQLTLEYGLVAATANDAAITVYDSHVVNNASGYAQNWAKPINVTLVGSGPIQIGHLITFGTQTHRYSVIDTDGSTWVLLDRPLEAAITNALPVNTGPVGGDMNFAYHRNAMTLAIRPLKAPMSGAGAISAVAAFNGIGLRLVITYDGQRQGHRVTADFLAGVKILDKDLGAVMLS